MGQKKKKQKKSLEVFSSSEADLTANIWSKRDTGVIIFTIILIQVCE